MNLLLRCCLPAAALLLMAWAGCSTEKPPESRIANMPNPASVHCIEQGGKLEIRKRPDGGEVGFCVFQDGSECEEWALFRGECKPGG